MQSGRDHYAHIYETDLDSQAQWLSYGAAEKANSVELLTKPHVPHAESVLELGAGTGAVIGELMRRGFADNYTAADYSPEACKHIQSSLANVRVHQIDITTDRLPGKSQVVVLSHVLEHLEQPERLLSAIQTNIDFDWLVIECPMEDLIASRFKNLFRDRRNNLAGHVQFFVPRTFKAMVGKYFDIAAERYYAPTAPAEVIRFVSSKNRATWARRFISYFTMGWGPRYLAPLWKRLWLGNCALLCSRRL